MVTVRMTQGARYSLDVEKKGNLVVFHFEGFPEGTFSKDPSRTNASFRFVEGQPGSDFELPTYEENPYLLAQAIERVLLKEWFSNQLADIKAVVEYFSEHEEQEISEWEKSQIPVVESKIEKLERELKYLKSWVALVK